MSESDVDDDLQEQIDENTQQIAQLCALLGQVTESIDALAESNSTPNDPEPDTDAGDRDADPAADRLPFYQ